MPPALTSLPPTPCLSCIVPSSPCFQHSRHHSTSATHGESIFILLHTCNTALSLRLVRLMNLVNAVGKNSQKCSNSDC